MNHAYQGIELAGHDSLQGLTEGGYSVSFGR